MQKNPTKKKRKKRPTSNPPTNPVALLSRRGGLSLSLLKAGEGGLGPPRPSCQSPSRRLRLPSTRPPLKENKTQGGVYAEKNSGKQGKAALLTVLADDSTPPWPATRAKVGLA